MKILIWTKHPGDLLGEAIDFLTHGDAQHAGFLRDDGVTVHEAYLPKVRDRPLINSEKRFVRKFSLGSSNMSELYEKRFDKDLEKSISYSIEDLFKYELNVPYATDQSTICSSYVFATIMLVDPGFLPLKRINDCQVSPRDLLISPLLIEEYWS